MSVFYIKIKKFAQNRIVDKCCQQYCGIIVAKIRFDFSFGGLILHMDIEIAAVMTVACKLGKLGELLDKRIERAAVDTVSPTLPLLEKVRKLGEYKRLAANLAVMDHRLRCALGDDADIIVFAARRRYGLDFGARQVKSAIARAKSVLKGLGVQISDLEGYKSLPLYRAECKKLDVLRERLIGANVCRDAAYACFPVGRTAQAL